ncbi:MAG: efflux RND transporter periplasmic adaptor subunit, partial [Muribaculaceae bacterium]|nr:efflux RND transporter periplasmic adaptor subunit [Muribaculaceae bacterium]
MKKTLFICLGAAVMAVVVSSCGLKKEEAKPAPPVKVTVEAVGISEENLSSSYSGTIESGNEADMSFPVGGTIKKIYVNVGQKVAKGQVLAELDASDLIHANNIAQATLTEAQDAYNRMKKLHDANALPDIQWVDVQAKLKQAQNAAAISARGIKDARIYSPINGVVAEKLADVGQTAAPAIPIVKIVGVGDVKVSISV